MRPNTPSSSTALPAGTGPVLVIHGGAGTIPRHAMSEREHALHGAALAEVLRAGEQLLAAGAPALEVVTEAVRLLEDCEYFNAGRGAVYTAEGRHELDACVMDGRDRRAGAVAGVRTVRNPIRLARCVMERTPHAFLIGAAADALAVREGLEIVDPDWFGTPLRRVQLDLQPLALRHGGRRGAGRARSLGCGHLHRRHDKQMARPCGRFADRGRRLLRLRRRGGGVLHRDR
jgi:isoaspartyl peptidase/L-asparaginase-like protein (Ntn-hydrolase superfamily)